MADFEILMESIVGKIHHINYGEGMVGTIVLTFPFSEMNMIKNLAAYKWNIAV